MSAQETVASRVRQMAAAVKHVPELIRATFKASNPNERIRLMQQAGLDIVVGLQPFFNWLERRRPPGAAAPIIARLNSLLENAVRCVCLDIPEFAGGEARPLAGEPSAGNREVILLIPAAMIIADMLMGWAADIETEDAMRAAKPYEPAAPGANPASPPPSAAPSRSVTDPFDLLTCWNELLSAVNMKNTEKNRATIKRLDELCPSPILWPDRGGQPQVVKSKLQQWFGEATAQLEREADERRRRQESASATASESHAFGRTGNVAPGVGGHVKKRKKPKPR